MLPAKERILVVESDPKISDFIAEQTLIPLGYRIEIARVAGEAIQRSAQFAPDLIIANLNLPGLSGKDLLVALSSQGIDVPVIVIAKKGAESDLIQAFRLGAADYLLWPFREAELISAVERAVAQVRSRREREQLAKKLHQANNEMQQRVRELTTIYSIGKAVTSITDQGLLFEKLVDAAVYISEADAGWLLLRMERSKEFLLSAQHNLPPNIASRLNQPWDDGISSLVSLSGEALSIHGEPINRFKISQLAQSLLVVPIRIKKEVIGLLAVARKAAKPFNPSTQALLEAVADYASISLVNARLFRALEERARTYQQSAEALQAKVRDSENVYAKARQELEASVHSALKIIQDLQIGENMRLNATQKTLLKSTNEKLQNASQVLDNLPNFNN
jgi:two-component system, NtrC family, sensor kinase